MNSPTPSAGAVAPSFSLPPILVADDDADDLYFAVRLVKRTGTAHPVVTFSDGAGIIGYLTQHWLNGASDLHAMPRLLFLDLKMAGLGGFEFLEWVRRHRVFAPLNIIVLTGSSRTEDVERAKELGAKRYLVKHPSLSTFATIVHSVYPAQVMFQPPAGVRHMELAAHD